MEDVLRQLKEDYQRTIDKIKDDPFRGKELICYEDVLKAHYLIADYFIHEGEKVIFGVKDFNLLGSTLGRQFTSFGGHPKWTRPEEICATLFYGLIKNHAFHDANKRTALLTLLYQLNRLGRTISAQQKEFECLAVDIAKDGLHEYKRFEKFKNHPDKEVLFIAEFLKSNTRLIDKKYYQITFQEFERLLKKYDCHMEVVAGCHVDIIKEEKRKIFFGKNKIERRKVIQIGFPGWKRQINPKAVKEVLKAAGLTAENGIDSQVFFHGTDPLGALIDEYRGPLKRLKDK